MYYRDMTSLDNLFIKKFGLDTFSFIQREIKNGADRKTANKRLQENMRTIWQNENRKREKITIRKYKNIIDIELNDYTVPKEWATN